MGDCDPYVDHPYRTRTIQDMEFPKTNPTPHAPRPCFSTPHALQSKDEDALLMYDMYMHALRTLKKTPPPSKTLQEPVQ